MRRVVSILFLPVMAVVWLLPGTAWASSHMARVSDGLTSIGVPAWLAMPLATVTDNVIHVYEHVVLTISVVMTEPLVVAVAMLNQIGAACFSAASPWAHLFFANGAWALASTGVLLLGIVTLLAFVSALLVRRWRGSRVGWLRQQHA